MEMGNRRTFLKSGAVGMTAVLAGCSDSIPGLGGPKYEQDQEFEFDVETLRERLSDDWEIPEESANDNFEYEFDLYDEEGNLMAFVMADAMVYESVEEAEKQIADRHVGQDDEKFELADEAYVWEESDHARAYFRESNAMGGVVAARASGFQTVPDTRRAINGARAFYDNW